MIERRETVSKLQSRGGHKALTEQLYSNELSQNSRVQKEPRTLSSTTLAQERKQRMHKKKITLIRFTFREYKYYFGHFWLTFQRPKRQKVKVSILVI